MLTETGMACIKYGISTAKNGKNTLMLMDNYMDIVEPGIITVKRKKNACMLQENCRELTLNGLLVKRDTRPHKITINISDRVL